MLVRRLAFGLTAVLAVLAACDDFSQDAPTPLADAGSDTSAPSENDADVTADGPVPGETGSSFCSGFPTAQFCTSFDDPKDKLTAGRADVQVLSTGSQPVPVEGGEAFSPPSSMSTEVSSNVVPVGNPGPQSGIVLTTTTEASKLHCEFQLWADFTGTRPDAGAKDGGLPTENVDIILGSIGATSLRTLFDFSLRPQLGTMSLVPFAGFSDNHVQGPVIVEKSWLPIVFDLAIDSGNISATATVGGTRTATKTVTTAVTKFSNLALTFGQSYVMGRWTIRLDDIVCTWN